MILYCRTPQPVPPQGFSHTQLRSRQQVSAASGEGAGGAAESDRVQRERWRLDSRAACAHSVQGAVEGRRAACRRGGGRQEEQGAEQEQHRKGVFDDAALM